LDEHPAGRPRRWPGLPSAPGALVSLAAALVIVGVLVAVLRPSPGPQRPGSVAGSRGSGGITGVRVSQGQLVDDDGRPVRLLGYNLAGAEYSCVDGQGIFDTPDGGAPSDRVIRAMLEWRGTTAVRLPLNEQCWLGLGVDDRHGGPAYRSAVRDLVSRLNRHGLAVIVDLHRSAPGTARSLEQEPMPDRDHSPAFWRSVGGTFKDDRAVAFDLFNEPFPFEEEDSTRAWTCWRDGGCSLVSANSGGPFETAGTSELLHAVRSTGARNVVFLGGVYWAESLTQWMRFRPEDPAGQLGASFHAYSFNRHCSGKPCYDRELGPIVASVPLLVSEIGPDLAAGSRDVDRTCPPSVLRDTGFDAAALSWFDRHGVSYTAWTWNPWGDCWSLIQDWEGTATPVWGRRYRAHLAGTQP
jgi:endoglucanase